MSVSNEMHLADRRVTEWFRREQARRENAALSHRAPSIRPIITISRQFGAGGHSVAQSLADILGEPWQVWDKSLIEAVATSAHMRREMVEAMDERAQSWMDEMLHRCFGREVMEPATYRKHLGQVLLALAQQGYIIIVGRGANFVLHDALNVRLQASEHHRIKTAMAREGLSEEAAIKRLHQVDHERAEFTNDVFGRNIDDPSAYDIVIQTDGIGIEATVAAIVAAARAMYHLSEPAPILA